jgi:transposase-like protein
MKPNEFRAHFAQELSAQIDATPSKKRYSPQFKEATLSLLEQGLCRREVTEITQVHSDTITRWKRHARPRGPEPVLKLMHITEPVSDQNNDPNVITIDFPSGLCLRIPIVG